MILHWHSRPRPSVGLVIWHSSLCAFLILDAFGSLFELQIICNYLQISMTVFLSGYYITVIGYSCFCLLVCTGVMLYYWGTAYALSINCGLQMLKTFCSRLADSIFLSVANCCQPPREEHTVTYARSYCPTVLPSRSNQIFWQNFWVFCWIQCAIDSAPGPVAAKHFQINDPLLYLTVTLRSQYEQFCWRVAQVRGNTFSLFPHCDLVQPHIFCWSEDGNTQYNIYVINDCLSPRGCAMRLIIIMCYLLFAFPIYLAIYLYCLLTYQLPIISINRSLAIAIATVLYKTQ